MTVVARKIRQVGQPKAVKTGKTAKGTERNLNAQTRLQNAWAIAKSKGLKKLTKACFGVQTPKNNVENIEEVKDFIVRLSYNDKKERETLKANFSYNWDADKKVWLVRQTTLSKLVKFGLNSFIQEPKKEVVKKEDVTQPVIQPVVESDGYTYMKQEAIRKFGYSKLELELEYVDDLSVKCVRTTLTPEQIVAKSSQYASLIIKKPAPKPTLDFSTYNSSEANEEYLDDQYGYLGKGKEYYR